MTHKNSFLIILSLIFLLPIFFIPMGVLDLPSAKSALLVLGIVAAVLVYLYEAWKATSISLPKHSFIYVVALLPLVYLLSALLSTPSSLSLLGYNMEAGTFGFILLGTILLVLASLTFAETGRALQALVAFFSTLTLIALFIAIKIFLDLSTSLEVNNMGNPLGAWTDLAVAFGALAVFAILAVGMIPMKLWIKALLYAVFVISATLLVILNFSTAFMLTFAASIFLWLYFSKIEKHYFNAATPPEKNFFSRPTFLPLLLGVISLLMLINPVIPSTEKKLGAIVVDTFNISNSDVRPTLGATFSISKQVLSQVALLGSGPNTFGHDWLIFKPVDVNSTPFWGMTFPFGAGFIPTQIASTGILGSALWLAFFVLLIALAVKALAHIPESRSARFTLVSALSITLFIWVASFFYAPSVSLLMLGFAFAGILLALLGKAGIIPSHTINLSLTPQERLGSMLVVGALVVGVATLGWFGFSKTVSAYHFQRAITLSNTAPSNSSGQAGTLADVENQLMKAVQFAPVDTHYIAISRLNFSKAQAAANSATDSTGSPQAAAIFQDALSKSIAAARSAVAINPAGYQNWVSLGQIYAALVPEPLKVEGAYENALFAYNEALKRNPNNPELPLFLAQLELNKGDVEKARSYIRSSIALKEDYADAYLALAQLEIAQKNLPAAIESTEVLVQLAPNNAGIHFELGLLKYSGEDYEGAQMSFTKALQLVPNYANAKYYLGLAFSRLGRKNEAKAEFEELLLANPDNAELKQALEDLE